MQQRAAPVFLLVFITLASITSVPHLAFPSSRNENGATIAQSPTGASGFLYPSPANTTNLPVNHTFTVSIQASNMSLFNGWDIYVEANPAVITPISANFTNDLFETNSTTTATPILASECINGVSYTAAQCTQPTGAGIVEFAAATLGTPTVPTPIYGRIFNITYRVVAPGSGSLIQILDATLGNGGLTSIAPPTIDAVYGKPAPGFEISTNPHSIRVEQGLNQTVSLSLVSEFGFHGVIKLNATGPLGITISNPTLTLVAGGNATTSVTIITGTAEAILYFETITAYNGTAANSVSDDATLRVNVQPASYFVMGLSLGLLRIHAGNSANTTIIIQSYGFSGNVSLNVQAPLDLGVTYTLSPQVLIVHPGPSPIVAEVFTASLNVSTPIISLPFLYLINITATGVSSGSSPLIPPPIQLKVAPPPVSFVASVNPSTVSVRAGETGNATITVDSVDYFWGFLYTSAIMSGGAVGFNSTIYYIPLPNSPHVSYTPEQRIGVTFKIDANTPPGNYVVLLTIYSLASSYERGYSIQIPITVSVDSPVLHASNEVFGLASWIYFTILAVLAIPLLFLSIQTFRRREKEDEDWRA